METEQQLLAALPCSSMLVPPRTCDPRSPAHLSDTYTQPLVLRPANCRVAWTKAPLAWEAPEREALGFSDMTQLLPRDVSVSSDQVLIVLGFEEVRLELPGMSCRQTPWGLCIQCPVLPLVGLASWLPRSQGAWNCSGLKVRFEKEKQLPECVLQAACTWHLLKLL